MRADPDDSGELIAATGDAAGVGPDFGELPGLLGYELRRAQLAVFKHFMATVAQEDITPGLYGTLVLIDRNQGMSQSDLARALSLDRSTMVAVIDQLERRGLVQRLKDPGDRRRHALHLTAGGRSFLDRVRRRVGEHERTIAQDLSEQERQQLFTLLRKLQAGVAR